MNRTALASVWPPTRSVAVKAGHAPVSPMQAIRRRCLDCSGQQLAEVKLCEAVTCPLWPFRAGRHPYTRKALLEADSGEHLPGGTLEPRSSPPSGIGLQQASGGKDGGNEAEAAFTAYTAKAI